MIDMSKNRYKQKGISLIEVLVALVVLAFGVLGIAGLQGYSMKYNYSAYLRSQASYLASDIMDVMRLRRSEAVVTAEFNLTKTASETTITGTSSVKNDLQTWIDSLAALPQSSGEISCSTSTSVCNVTIEWDDSRGAAAAQSFQLSARL